MNGKKKRHFVKRGTVAVFFQENIITLRLNREVVEGHAPFVYMPT